MNQRIRTSYRPMTRSVVAEHSVLRNTYLLLGMTLLWSALTAAFSIYTAKQVNPLIDIIGIYGLLFLVQANAHTSFGIVCTFLFTGFMGYTLGPLLSLVLYGVANGSQLLMVSLATTGIVFVSLSAYVATSKHSFGFMGGTLFVLLISSVVLSLCALLFSIPLLFILTSALMVLVSSGLIMYHTSEIVHGGETNYILATISLYVALYNLFVNMLQLMLYFNGSRRD